MASSVVPVRLDVGHRDTSQTHAVSAFEAKRSANILIYGGYLEIYDIDTMLFQRLAIPRPDHVQTLCMIGA
jgi:hypothetical protein